MRLNIAGWKIGRSSVVALGNFLHGRRASTRSPIRRWIHLKPWHVRLPRSRIRIWSKIEFNLGKDGCFQNGQCRATFFHFIPFRSMILFPSPHDIPYDLVRSIRFNGYFVGVGIRDFVAGVEQCRSENHHRWSLAANDRHLSNFKRRIQHTRNTNTNEYCEFERTRRVFTKRSRV